MERLPHVLSRAEPGGLSPGLSCTVAPLQGWGGEGVKVLFLNLLGQECSLACQGTAELAAGPSCSVLPSPPSLANLPSPLTADDDDNGNDDGGSNG